MKQVIISGKDSYKKIAQILLQYECQKFMLVCDSAFIFLNLKDYFDGLMIPYVVFDKFSPNPLYEDVCRGVELFRKERCEVMIAVGGGSTIDVAKCIKLYSQMDEKQNYLEQEYRDTGVPLLAVPTTAGTGSESTRYAVIYYEGKKQSVTHDSIVPNYAILSSEVLRTLPLYQKKCTMLDALCQGIESWWSVNSTEESREYSQRAVQLIMRYMDAYINDNSAEAAEQIMIAANYAGRAINITQTTAPHAMSYKLTSLYNIPHGHAVAICLPKVWKYMQEHLEQCIDTRGREYLLDIFMQISKTLGVENVESAIDRVEDILQKLEIEVPNAKKEELEILVSSVNLIRLKNNPVRLNELSLKHLYERILFQ